MDNQQLSLFINKQKSSENVWKLARKCLRFIPTLVRASYNLSSLARSEVIRLSLDNLIEPEMEKDVLMSHGVSHFLMEKFRDDSDGFDIYVCRSCGKRPNVNEKDNEVVCKTCEAAKFSPDVVKIRTTWASKLFIDEMMSCNIGVDLKVKPYTYEYRN